MRFRVPRTARMPGSGSPILSHGEARKERHTPRVSGAREIPVLRILEATSQRLTITARPPLGYF